jgi:hypothetical protein
VAQFLQPDFSKGDVNTVAGYAAVHGRPAAFEGSDGFSYSAEILSDEDRDQPQPWGAYLFFVRWTRIGASAPEGHLESDILARAALESEARQHVGATPLSDASRVLHELIARSTSGPARRKWWDAMNADDSHGAA